MNSSYFNFLLVTFLCINLGTQGQIKDISQADKKNAFEGEQNEYVVGNIQDAKFLENQISILDRNDSKILILNKNGDLIQKVGKEGRGPGEYVSPITLETINNDLIILDGSLNRITRYAYTNQKGFQLKNSGTFNLNMTDICISNGSIWVYAHSENNIVHQISNDLSKVSKSISGGFDFRDNPSMLEIAKEGYISCDDKYIYAGFSKDNSISIYNISDGSLLKKIQFKEITPLKISAVPGPDGNPRFAFNYYEGEAYDKKGDYHDTLKNIILIDGNMLAQYKRSFSEAESDQEYIISLFVNPNDGSYTVHKDWPMAYDYENKHLLTGSDFPAPQINIYKFD